MSFDNAFIGYNNYFTATASTLTASGVDTGFNINSLKNWQAFDYVQFASGTNYAQIDCGSAVNIDFLAIAPMNYSLKTVLPSRSKAQVTRHSQQVPRSPHLRAMQQALHLYTVAAIN